MTKTQYAQFNLGDIVRHSLLGYRGVIVDIDPIFQGNEKWYEAVVVNQATKDQPWYHLLIDGLEHWAYAAQSNLESDGSGIPIDHPELEYFFDDFNEGTYIPLALEDAN